MIAAVSFIASRHALALFDFATAARVSAILVSHCYLPPFYGLTVLNFYTCEVRVMPGWTL